MQAIEDLKNFGFNFYGIWSVIEGTSKSFSYSINSDSILNKEIFLYAFILNDTVMYIGKSDRSVRKRLAGWANTKESLKKKIKARIEFNKTVRSSSELQIYLCFPEIEIMENAVIVNTSIPLDKDVFNSVIKKGINQGLESKLIKYFQKNHSQCKWNYKVRQKTKRTIA